MKKSNIKAVNVNINVWNEIRWGFYTTLCKMKNIRWKKKYFPPPDKQQSCAEYPRPILLCCYLDEPTVMQPEEVWDIKQRLNNLSCRSHSRNERRASPEKSCLFRWADKCKIKKKMSKINHGCKVIGHICKVDRRWRQKLVCLFNAFTTELSSAIVITPWAEGWKYSTSTLSYVRKSSNSFRDPHSQCWAMRLCTDRHVIVCWAWLAINWRR